jgi:hypothetical protein
MPPHRTLLLVCALTLAALGPLPTLAQAPQAFGASPPIVDVVNAQAGQTYHRSVTIQNQLDSQSTILLERDGAAAAWTTTEPASGFAMPARSNRVVELTIQVPAGTAGNQSGVLRFVTEQKGDPLGSGAGIRYAVGVRIDVAVEGTAQVLIEWRDATTQDVDTATPPRSDTELTNRGNVRTTVRAKATVLAFESDTPLANATVEAALDPGQDLRLALIADRVLPPGQYRFRVQALGPGTFEKTLEFKVFQPGTVAPKGVLRALRHEPRVAEATPMRIDVIFANEGNVTVQDARFIGEMRSGGRLVAPIASERLVVAPGEEVEITIYWTPPSDGVFELVGKVHYDGYRTLEAKSLINVLPGPAAMAPLWILGAAVLVVIGLGGVFYARRRRR